MAYEVIILYHLILQGHLLNIPTLRYSPTRFVAG